jgi:hypothetical protein
MRRSRIASRLAIGLDEDSMVDGPDDSFWWTDDDTQEYNNDEGTFEFPQALWDDFENSIN